jgi:outer membrane lipoprotein-sorting protein
MSFPGKVFIAAAIAVFTLPTWAADAPLTAADIMARVAANQDKSEQLRAQYVYTRHFHVTSRKTNGKLMCEETGDYQVVPTPDGEKAELKKLDGKVFHKGKFVAYNTDAKQGHDDEFVISAGGKDEQPIDRQLVQDFRRSDSKQTRDGVDRNLFPLTSKRQAEYAFRLLGEQTLNGRAVYHLSFEPKNKNDIDWAGEAFIDKEEFQPVHVFTKLSKKLPLLVRGALGTNLPGIGFSVTYARQPDGVWFPVTMGSEFRLKILFVFSRDIAMSMANSHFEHTKVESKIVSVSTRQ